MTSYLEHFGLRERPFKPTPDLAGYYPAASHEDVLGRLHAAIGDGEGFALLTAEPGLGKTLIAGALIARIGDEATSVMLPHAALAGKADLLQAILYDLKLPYKAQTEQELRLQLSDWLFEQLAAGRRLVLIVDEAHLLSADLLEELRLLGNIEGPQGKAIQVLLFGLPALADNLRKPALGALRQRIAVKAELEALGAHESVEYIVHQLRMAGALPDALFDDDAMELIARSAGGVPRLINQCAHEAMRLTALAGSGRVDVEAATDAAMALGLSVPETESTAVEPAPAPPMEFVVTGKSPMWPTESLTSPTRLLFAPGRGS